MDILERKILSEILPCACVNTFQDKIVRNMTRKKYLPSHVIHRNRFTNFTSVCIVVFFFGGGGLGVGVVPFLCLNYLF